MMKVIWYTRARLRWLSTGDYIRQAFGVRAQETFILSTAEWIGILKQMPQAGMLEPLLTHRTKDYRSVVINKLNKLIYFIEDNTIYIADFWDTRREPQEQANRLK